jgi:acyl-CoA synthetase (NDP forming)
MTLVNPTPEAGLRAMFAPESIAVIGSSGDENRIGGRPLKYLRQFGFPGRIYPINPRYQELQGLACYPDVASLPESVDLAIIALGAEHVLPTVEALIARGVRAAVVFAAEFAEHGEEGRRKQAALTELARASGIRILGPNTVGMRDAEAAVFGTFSTDIDSGLRNGPLAIITQSGGLGIYFGAVLPRLAGFGARYMIDTGNEADVDSAECIEYVSRDPSVRAIGLVLEGTKDGRRFVEACALARQRGKRVIALKIGRTAEGAIAAASHSGALAGEDAVWDAALRAGGVVRAHDEVEFFDLLNVHGVTEPPAGPRLGIVSLSGGVITLMIDACSDVGLEIPHYDAPPRELLKGIPEGAKGNPLDVSANLANNPDITGPILEHVLQQDTVDALVLWMAYLPMSPILGPPIAAQIRQVAERATKPIYLVGLPDEDFAAEVVGAGVPIFSYPTRLLTALARATQASEPTLPGTVQVVADDTLPLRALTGPMAESALPGVPFAASAIIERVDDVVSVAARLGFPMVMKGEAEGLLHKTELGLVRVGISDTAGASSAYRELRAILDEEANGGVVVAQELVRGTECFVGARRDPVFGPTVTFGMGGTLVEHERDVVTLLAPTRTDLVLAAMESLRGYPRLLGLRGEPRRDIEALAALVVGLSEAIADDGSMVEVDLNPVMVRANSDGVVAVDAVVVRRTGGLEA